MCHDTERYEAPPELHVRQVSELWLHLRGASQKRASPGCDQAALSLDRKALAK